MRLSPSQASLMAQLYTAGGVLRQTPLNSDPGVRPTVAALRRKGLVETYYGLVVLTPAGWAYEDDATGQMGAA